MKLYLLDASAMFFRAYYTAAPLSRPSDGHPVGAISAYVSMLWRYIIMAHDRTDGPTHIGVIHDGATRKTFRHDIYPEYKAHRNPTPDDLKAQMELMRAAPAAFNLASVSCNGFEADDVIATLAVRAAVAGAEVVIVSSDKDPMQLIGGRVVMYCPMKSEFIGPLDVHRKWGVPPYQLRDVLALMGDAADNVPGVPKIGPKTAAKLVNTHGGLGETLAAAKDGRADCTAKQRALLVQHEADARLSYDLIGLRYDVPIQADLDSLAVRRPTQAAVDFLDCLEFITTRKTVVSWLAVQGESTWKTSPTMDIAPPF
jgi:DNA polymerase I